MVSEVQHRQRGEAQALPRLPEASRGLVIEVAVGLCKSGKTTRLKRRARELVLVHKRPVVALACNPADFVPDPQVLRAPLRLGIVRTPEGAARALAAAVPNRMVVLRCEGNASREMADELARVVCERRDGTVLVLPEVHRYLREHKPAPEWLGNVLHQFQHYRCALLADTQHFADVRKELLREVTLYYLHAQSPGEDLDLLRKRFGVEVERQVLEVSRRFAPVDKGGLGQRGWHIELCPQAAFPPFPILR